MLEHVPASVVVLEGSGSVIPPVRADATICVAAATQPRDYITGYLGSFRLLVADLVLLTLCEPPFASAREVGRLATAIHRARPQLEVIATVFRPRPTAAVRGRRVALFTTAAPLSLPSLTAYLHDAWGAEVVAACADLADRPALVAAVLRAQREADVFLTEIKAAGIDVVAEAATAAGKELVFYDNELVAVDGADVAAALRAQATLAHRRFAARQTTAG
jgi:cyclic 2,3-diphosphoglycerate synthetase